MKRWLLIRTKLIFVSSIMYKQLASITIIIIIIDTTAAAAEISN